MTAISRKYEVGAEVLSEGGVNFRVWAPGKQHLAVVLWDKLGQPAEYPMQPQAGGYFAGTIAEASANDLYQFRVNDGKATFPDPASRFQPHVPAGPSQIIDASQFPWSDGGWKGVRREGQVIYELHLGTFTAEGTYAAAAEQLDELAKLGITVIELMPVAEFAGDFGWGYDGVCLFAPTHLYGKPDDLRRFIDRAHGCGMGVILDVVYNHLGPIGRSLEQFSDYYFSDRYGTDWGAALNFDGAESAEVRRFYLANAAYWIDEFHFDGLRIDATQDIHDSSAEHILAALARRVRNAAKNRGTLLIAENEPQHTELVRPEDQGGFGLDAVWNDDFHHTAHIALTGRAEAYYSDYRGSPQEFISVAKYGYLYQGQWYQWQGKSRGTPGFDLPPAAFVNYLQNHDQIANSIRGLRCHKLSSPGCLRAMTALFLLSPGTPLLFQGQEFAASQPFCFFSDLGAELAKSVRRGRQEFLAQFRSLESEAAKSYFPDPASRETFHCCKLDFSERQSHAEIYALHGDLLRLRREDPVFRQPRRGGLDGAVLGPTAFVLRYFGEAGDDRLLVVNLAVELCLSPAPEPLLAPPRNGEWQLLWSSEDPVYGGSGVPQLWTDSRWTMLGQAAIVLSPQRDASR